MIPDRIRVGSWFYRVVLAEIPEEDGETIHGIKTEPHFQADGVGIISISQTLTGKPLYSTILHEILHCLDDTYNLGLGENGVAVLEDQLSGVAMDNPAFMRCWLDSQLADGNAQPREVAPEDPRGHSGGFEFER